MSKSLFTGIFCFIILSLFFHPSYAQDMKWIRYGSGSLGNKAWAVANDANGNVYTAGHIGSDVTIQGVPLEINGVRRVFITKHDSTGTLLWARIMGTTGGNHYYDDMDVKIDAAGNCYVAGSFANGDGPNVIEGVNLKYNNFFIVKYDPSGTPLWAKGYGGSATGIYEPIGDDCQVNSMVLDGDYMYITGGFKTKVVIGSVTLTPAKEKNLDLFLCKLDLSGNVQFAKQYGNNALLEVGRDVAVNKSGEVFVTGDQLGILKFSNTGVLTQTLPPYANLRSKGIGVDENDNVYQFGTYSGSVSVGGTTISANVTGHENLLLIKYDKKLKLKWFKYPQGASAVWGLNDAMETDQYGNTYIGGDAFNLEFGNATISEGLFIVKYDSTGAVKGTNNIITDDGYAHDISIGPNGRYYMSGGIGPSFFIAAYKDTLKNTSPGWVAAKNLRTGQVGGYSVELLWDDTGVQEETEFTIERSIYPDRTFKYVATVPANTITYVNNTGIRDNATYYYRVRANGPQGYSKYSNVVKATTPLSPPPKPGGLNAYKIQLTETEVGIAWYAHLRATSYELEYSVNNSNNFTLLAKTSGTFVKLTDAQPNTLYSFRLRAFNETGASEYAEVIYTGHLVTPLAPDNLAATTSSSTAIALTWQDNATSEKGFYIEQALSDAGPFSPVDTVAADVNTVTIGSLLPNTTYYFRVRAFNYTVLSDYTQKATATTAPAQPEQVAGPSEVVNTEGFSEYSVPAQPGLTYIWDIDPKEAGTITVLTEENTTGRTTADACQCSKIRVTWNAEYTGTVNISVKAINGNLVSEQTRFNVNVRNAVVTDVKEFDSASAVSIFPNPAHGAIEIRVGTSVINSAFEIIRPDGVVILRGQLVDTSTKVELNDIPGLYLLKIQTKGTSTYHKLILK